MLNCNMKYDNTLGKKMSHATIPLNRNSSKNWRKVKPNVSDKAGLLPGVGVAIGIGIEKRIKTTPMPTPTPTPSCMAAPIDCETDLHPAHAAHRAATTLSAGTVTWTQFQFCAILTQFQTTCRWKSMQIIIFAPFSGWHKISISGCTDGETASFNKQVRLAIARSVPSV